MYIYIIYRANMIMQEIDERQIIPTEIYKAIASNNKLCSYTNNVISVIGVQGLYYLRHAVDHRTEHNIIKVLDKCQWYSMNDHAVQHYGYLYVQSYGIMITNPIPDFLKTIQRNLTSICIDKGLISNNDYFNQCTINNYFGSQGISAHKDDDKYGDVIGCFTLNAGSTVLFKNHKTNMNVCMEPQSSLLKKRKTSINVYMEPQSLYIMSGESRQIWTHEIPIRQYDMHLSKCIPRGRRISVTFRNLKK
jgi:alkylated DNA repair dioxygenase AlkB